MKRSDLTTHLAAADGWSRKKKAGCHQLLHAEEDTEEVIEASVDVSGVHG